MPHRAIDRSATFDDRRLSSTYWALRATYAAVPFLAGLDKFFGLLADWSSYLSPTFARLLPMSPTSFMYLVGVVEMVVGLMVLTRFTRLGAYLAMAWLICISINLLSAAMPDIAVRDLAMAVGAFALARLEEARLGVGARARTRASVPVPA